MFRNRIPGIDSHVHTRSGLGRMDAITALASWPKSIDELAHAVASPPTVAEIRDVARAIGDGDARLIGDGGRTNFRLTRLNCRRRARRST